MNEPVFRYEMKVRDYECDAQGIVNNANYQHYYEVARHEFLEMCNLNFKNLHDKGLDLVVSQVQIKYKTSLLGMDRFLCTIKKIEKKGVRYIFHQEIVRIPDGQICSMAQIEVVSLVGGKLSKPEFVDNHTEFQRYVESWK
ncbi:acyl-CoA thioester hydrolase [Dysgonomonas sp. PH5-45]|uniref:acyl-CoA thioesterase n=1 Tax=unclassified Dysgonomonas TaxID=2630389 RepID=UPI0024746168|nr:MULTISPECIES: acyl-CoA thioesterase [unclassified Dysgonomonas]MDH6355930.1 acyl-CoA thioester hydrolase [Dysgonomonas sp. PH5-45]MDH6388825.1 acyl-CoA thioester hydrolase [Dysgonomonas sp. PH5-37]